MKTLLCAIVRKENEYLREWVEYNLFGLQFSHIIIYDNNYEGEDDINDVISDYIKQGLVEVINFKNKKKCQLDAYNECLLKNTMKYDWMAFFDIDEFLTFNSNSKFRNIKEYLSDDRFNEYDCILVQWIPYGDNEQIKKTSGKVIERFKTKAKYSWEYNLVKPIIRGRIPGIYFWENGDVHFPVSTLYRAVCDGSGTDVTNEEHKPWISTKTRTDICAIRHYVTKSLEEYITKIKRYWTFNNEITKEELEEKIRETYFRLNNVTQEKVDYIKEQLDIDVSDLL